MSETSSSSGEYEHRPPSPEQIETISGLVKQLTSTEEVRQLTALKGGIYPAPRYTFVDDDGERHNVIVADYTQATEPLTEEPEKRMFVNDTKVLDPFAPNHWNLVEENGALVLKVDAIEGLGTLSSTFIDALGEEFGIGLNEMVVLARQDSDSREAADEMGLTTANADEARNLIGILTQVRERGSILLPGSPE